MVRTAGPDQVTVMPRSTNGPEVERRLQRTYDGWGKEKAVGKTVSKTVGEKPPENGWQPFSVKPNGNRGRKREEGYLRVPSFSLSLFSEKGNLLRERVVRLLIISSRQQLDCWDSALFQSPAVGLPGLCGN